MDITQEQLDQWRRCLGCMDLMSSEAVTALDGGNSDRVRDLLRDIRDHAVQIGYKMEDAGAAPPPNPPC